MKIHFDHILMFCDGCHSDLKVRFFTEEVIVDHVGGAWRSSFSTDPCEECIRRAIKIALTTAGGETNSASTDDRCDGNQVLSLEDKIADVIVDHVCKKTDPFVKRFCADIKNHLEAQFSDLIEQALVYQSIIHRLDHLRTMAGKVYDGSIRGSVQAIVDLDKLGRTMS